MDPVALAVVVLAVAAAAVALALLLPGRVAAALAGRLDQRLEGLDRAADRRDQGLRDELARARAEAAASAQAQRGELALSFRTLNDAVLAQLTSLARLQQEQLDAFSRRLKALVDSGEQRADLLRVTVDERLERLRQTVEAQLRLLQEDNSRKLDQVRQTVDEKLQGTLEKRLGESFRLVAQQLETVQKGLGEMQGLAAGVGDLKKVLSNVKVRGTWGEVQLGALLEQMLSPDQYAANVATSPGSGERVEYVVRLPGREAGEGEVLLPIDAKFPLEDYQRLVDASERADAAGVEEASRALEQRIRACARDIRDKYLHPPRTTDFGILFLPTEGLYAEVVRRPGLAEALQRELRVTVAGPSTLTALLTSLQMGFRTLAIQQRSSEVWQVLGAVKTEFGKFGEVIRKVEEKLQQATNQLSQVGTRSRVIARKLREVEALPVGETAHLLPGGAEDADEPEEPVEPPLPLRPGLPS
jgi:DNA recombination protein RmuC